MQVKSTDILESAILIEPCLSNLSASVFLVKGVHMGFPRNQATTLVYHTMLGSTLYAIETGEHPAILRNRVTSPSGTTASALYELENGKFRTVIKDAMWACYRRSLEIGNLDSNVGPDRRRAPTHDEGV